MSSTCLKTCAAFAVFAAVLSGCAERPDLPVAPPAGDGAFYRSMAQAGARVDAAQARDMISLYRRNNGQGGVILDPTLQRVAEDQARAMAAANEVSHETKGVFKQRLDAAGFTKNAAVENVSAGYHTLPEAFSGWRQSRPHNANMLDARMKRMGIATAYAPGTKYKVFWALVMSD